MNRSVDEIKVKEKRCLEIEFLVNSDFIVPFSEKVMLYEIESDRNSEKILPQQVSSKTANEMRKSINMIEKTLFSINKEEDQMKVYEIGVMSTAQKKNEELYALYLMLAYGVALLILWSTYLEFLQFLGLLAFGAVLAFYYFSTQKYLLTKLELQEGFYKIEINGMVSLPANQTNQTNSFYLHATFNYLDCQKLKIHFYSMYSYAAPFSATFFVKSKKPQELLLELKKNNIYDINVNNVIITSQKVPYISQIK